MWKLAFSIEILNITGLFQTGNMQLYVVQFGGRPKLDLAVYGAGL